MKKIDFLIVGTQKGGTTALHKFFRSHPQIHMPLRKELHFFDNEKKFLFGKPNYEYYHQFFDWSEKYSIRGEGTPIYMYWKKVPKRIWRYNTKMKLIFILRDPAERAYSQFIMEKKRHNEVLPFSLVIRLEQIMKLTRLGRQDRIASYVDRGKYARQISRIAKHFSFDQMLFLKTEDLMNNHVMTMNRIFDFLKVDKLNTDNSERVFSNSYPPMKRRDRAYLVKEYQEDLTKLEKMLGWDCSKWKSV